MLKPTYFVGISPSEPLVTYLNHLQRQVYPAFNPGSSGPHITVVQPFRLRDSQTEEGLCANLQRYAQTHGCFYVEMSTEVRADNVGESYTLMWVTKRVDPLAELRDELRRLVSQAFADDVVPPLMYEPHITLVKGLDAKNAEMLARSVSRDIRPWVFLAKEVCVFRKMPEGKSEIIRRIPLNKLRVTL